ncbi:hypothetical protein LAZ67_19002562 [Cordylochernes scorpioides]|uniref:Transposase n=1 Tax=Cordylochernes scorpioides TaxID=51811 RepID=A0ABY6LIN1_9ARAC|nr:hypothetical protein LAZ67_19002562 [Cordylochernes scorpioides]
MGKNFKSIDHVRCGPPPRFPRMCGTSLKTINNIIHKDLELDTRRKGKVHKLTPFHMKNRATNARKLYEEHLAGSRSEYTATLDEAWMYVTYCNGIRKICYIKRGNQVPDNWVHQCSETFPKGFMVVGVMTGRGVLPLIKVPSKVKVNSEFYIECVLKPVIEQLKDLYPGEMDKVFLHHDKASSHTSNKTQQFLQEMKDTLGLNFIRNSDIPVKSPDASPLDFYGFVHVVQAMIIMVGRRRLLLLVPKFLDVAKSLRDAVMSRRIVFEWYKRFKEGREETADNERSGRPSTLTTPEKVGKVLKLVREDRRITVREVAEEARISFGSTQSIMKDILGNARKETASLNLEATTDDPELLKRVITGNETWIYDFDSETTQQASEWRFKNEPRPKKARKAPSKVKVMLTVFFDYQGIVHHEFQQQGSTITADSYLGVLRRLREAIRQKRPELWRSKSWILHHDNAPSHTALKISKFLKDHSTSVFPQPPYSPDLPPCDFFLFGKLKKR